jgi:hypothetical protein
MTPSTAGSSVVEHTFDIEKRSFVSATSTTGPTGPVDRPAAKDPQTWVTGDEPMTGPQQSYLQTLAREAGADLPDDLDKASASQKIDELQERTGRG